MEAAILYPALVLSISFVLMLIINAPIVAALGVSTLLTLYSVSASLPIPVEAVVAQRMAVGMESFSLLAIPMFIVSGNLLGRGGMARRIMDFAAAVMAPFPGGLALANVLACMLFGSISGSAAAAVSSVGGCMIPEMKTKNYPPEFCTAVTATAATTGLLIPPSNVMIVYGMAAGGVSISALFLAGILPGILTGFALMVAAIVISRWKGYGKTDASGISYMLIFRRLTDALPSLMIGVVVLGGILLGIFTATEAAAVAVVYAFIFAVMIYREVKLSQIPEILLDSAVTSAVVLLLIGSSSAMSWVLSFLDIPQGISAAMMTLSDNPWIILLLINVILLIVGAFMDMTPAILIFTPIFLPVMLNFGIDPIHFGIIMIANLCVGLCTPPVGTCLFVGCSVGGTRLLPTTKAMLPFFVAMFAALVLITVIPALSLWIPSFLK